VRLLNNLSCFLIGGFILLLISCLSFGQGDQPLVAVIDASPTSGPAPLSVVFDASRSTGDIITAYWDFGDGGYAYGKRVVHTYNVPGTYIVTLTVYDPARRSASASVTITVLQPSGQPPTLTLFEPQISGLTVTINGVTLPGTPGTTITRIHWIWGDGSEEDHWFPASHTYPKAGRYPIIVTSFQSDGLSTSKSLTVIVSQEETRPPVADFTYSPSNPKVNETIQFTDMSYDPDGYIISWSWDFGDGTTSTRQNPTHSYSTKGNYRVCLTVTDNTGAKNTACKTVTVEEAQGAALEVIFRGVILVSRPIISFYSFDISIQTILYDPTGVLRVGDVIHVGGHRDGPAKVDPVTVGDLVEVRGLLNVAIDPCCAVELTEARHYVKKIGVQGNLACFDLDYRGNPPNSDGNDQIAITAAPGATLTLFFRYNEGNIGNQYVIRVYGEWDKNKVLANSDNDEQIGEVGVELGGYRWDKELYVAPTVPGTYKVRVLYSASATPPTWDRYDRLLAEGTVTVTAPKPGNLTVFDLDYRGSPPFSDGNDQNFVTVEPGKQLTLFFKYDEGNAGNEYIIRVYAEWDKNRVIARSGYDSSEVRKERGWSCWDEGPYVAPTVPGTYKVRVLYSASATPPTWDRYDRLLAEGTVKVQGPDLPELAITFCTLIDEYPSLGVIFEITNLGTQPSSNTTVDVWLNVKGSPIKVHTLSVPSLAPKATTRFSCRLRRQDWTVVSLEQRRLLISSEVVIRVDPNNVVNEIYKTNNEARLPFYGDNVRASKLHYQICYTYLQSVIAMITNPKKSQDYEKALEAAWNELVQDLGKEIIGVWASAFPQDPIAILIAKRPSEAVENIIEDFKKYCKNVLDAFNNKTLLTTAQNWGLAERLEDVLASYYDFIETFKDPKASQKDFLVSLTALAGTGGYAYGLLEALVQLAKTIRVPQWMKELENWFVKGFYSTIMNVYCKDWLFHCKECIPDACVEVHYQFMTSRQDAYDKYIKYISISSMAPQEYNMLSAEKTVEFIIEPNPITDVNTTTFKAVGPPFIEVAEIEVEVFDLLGRLLWKGKNWGNEIAWHTQDLTGTYLANGIYLCIIRCRIQDKWFQSSVLKVVILR